MLQNTHTYFKQKHALKCVSKDISKRVLVIYLYLRPPLPLLEPDELDDPLEEEPPEPEGAEYELLGAE